MDTEHDATTRRGYLSGGAVVLGGLLAGCSGSVASRMGGSTDGSSVASSLAKFVTDLPTPKTVEPMGHRDGTPFYELTMEETTASFHPDLGDTTVWGYNGQVPGPSFEVERGQSILVHWKNDLPTDHLFPVDHTLPGAEGNPDVRTVTHLHGGNTDPESDGYPRAWFTNGDETRGPDFTRKVYEYANRQPPTTLWYHDHALGVARLNIYAGLAGLYHLRGDLESRHDLPTGKHEVPLVLQDRQFESDGTAYYPGPETNGVEPSIVPEFFGDVATVNGKAWPRLRVEPRTYRLHLLNASNARFYGLTLRKYDEKSGTVGARGPSFTQLAAEGGFLNRPTSHRRVLLGPAARGQYAVDFADHRGETLLLHNDAKTPYGGGAPTRGDDTPLPEIMLFDVADREVTDPSTVPKRFGRLRRLGDDSGNKAPVPALDPASAARERTLSLNELVDEYGRNLLLLDSERFSDPVTETPELGTTEVWHLVNPTDDTHPIHLHLVQFQVLGRRPINATTYRDTGAISPTGPAEPPAAGEAGWKDVIPANPGTATSIVVHFGEHDGLFRDVSGRFVWHCHMLEHENHGMIRPYEVVESDRSS